MPATKTKMIAAMAAAATALLGWLAYVAVSSGSGASPTADEASIVSSDDPSADAPTAVGSIQPPNTDSETPVASSTKANGADRAVSNRQRARLKPLADLTTRERHARVAARAGRLASLESRLDRARSAARDDGACRLGDQAACSRLDARDGQTRAALTKARKDLAAACEEGRSGACVQRGDLDVLAKAPADSAAWYAKARSLIDSDKAACATEGVGSRRLCERAARLERALQNRLEKLDAH